MTTAVQRRRGTTAQHATFTGLLGELTVDTTDKVVVVHDGVTAGGSPMMSKAAALASFVGVTTATGSAKQPVGTTAQRDVSPSFGYERANSTTGRKEWWDGTAWRMLYDSAVPVGSRNRVINGGCRIAQRGTVPLANSSLQYGGADRHIANLSATTVTGNILQVSGLAGTVTGFGFGVSQATTTGATSGMLIHRIEAQNTRDLSGKTVTVSLKVYHDFGSATNFGLSLYKANSADNFGATTQIGATTTTSVASATLTELTASFTLNSTDAANGLQITVAFTSSALTSKSFYWADVQLERGAVATTFDERLYGAELALCHRYYRKVSERMIFSGQVANATKYYASIDLPGMRTTPTISGITSANNSGGGFGSTDLSAVGSDFVRFNATSTTTTSSAFFYAGFEASSEL